MIRGPFFTIQFLLVLAFLWHVSLALLEDSSLLLELNKRRDENFSSICESLLPKIDRGSQNHKQSDYKKSRSVSSSLFEKVEVFEDDSVIAMSNGFTCTIFDKSFPKLAYLVGDIEGKGNYYPINSLGKDGITLQSIRYSLNHNKDYQNIRDNSLSYTIFSSSDEPNPMMDITVEKNHDDGSVQLKVNNLFDNVKNPAVKENWYIGLKPKERFIHFSTDGKEIIPEEKPIDRYYQNLHEITLKKNNISKLPISTNDIIVGAIYHNFTFQAASITAFYEEGVVQMMNQPNYLPNLQNQIGDYYPSQDKISHIYTVGTLGSVENQQGNYSMTIDFMRDEEMIRNKDYFDREHRNDISFTMLRSNNNTDSPTGFAQIMVSDFELHDGDLNTWNNGFTKLKSNIHTFQKKNTKLEPKEWKTALRLSPNNKDFPIASFTTGLYYKPTESTKLLSDKDMYALFTGIYGSPVNCLRTQLNAVAPNVAVGQIATTVHSPLQGYDDTYNYFDPDNYLSTTAMMCSGHSFIQEQVRKVIEHSGSYLTKDGQLPHHFTNLEPTYVALSGETQPGPNVFWILSAFNYAKNTANFTWLEKYMPVLRKASNFLFDLIDPEKKLLFVSGSLFIDVFIRNNFTADTNAMMVGFLREFADAEDRVGNITGANSLRNISDSIAIAMNEYLWNKTTNDHYITQLNKDGSISDFVDYDANLMAVANGVCTDKFVQDPSIDRKTEKRGKLQQESKYKGTRQDNSRCLSLLGRVDSGKCTHGTKNQGKATWVSEVYYGKNDTTDGNIGDSSVAMGRIGWFDALSRHYTADLQTFNNLLLNPLQNDLLRFTFMRERYDCDGKAVRTETYFEYPSVVVMMTRLIRYGIRLNMLDITVDPFLQEDSSFVYNIGNIYVDYKYNEKDTINLSFPGGDANFKRSLMISGINSTSRYQLLVLNKKSGDIEAKYTTNATEDGWLRFTQGFTFGEDMLYQILPL